VHQDPRWFVEWPRAAVLRDFSGGAVIVDKWNSRQAVEIRSEKFHYHLQPNVSSDPNEGGTFGSLRKVSCQPLFAVK
jgi:hypothetical protein